MGQVESFTLSSRKGLGKGKKEKSLSVLFHRD